MAATTLPAVQHGPLTTPMPGQIPRGLEPVVTAVDALKAIRTFVMEELEEGIDFGVIPGAGDKPTLLKPGAEKVALYYQTRIGYHVDRVELGEGHVEFQVRCELISRASGSVVAEGLGSCCTMESKYRWRKAERTCPECGAAAVIRGRPEYGGGWICFSKRGGCGAKFRDGDPGVESQQTGRVENPDIWDARNTVLKMALKRALVCAVLSLGSLSERFTQDIEDIYELPAEHHRPALESVPAPAPQPAPPAAGGRKRKPRDERTVAELIGDGCASVEAEFRAEFPDGPWHLTPFQVERHLLKTLTGKSTEKKDHRQVAAALFDAYEGPQRQKIRRELKAYLAEQLAAARRAQTAADFDAVTDPGGASPDDQPDPEVDYEGVSQAESEPGEDG